MIFRFVYQGVVLERGCALSHHHLCVALRKGGTARDIVPKMHVFQNYLGSRLADLHLVLPNEVPQLCC